MQFKFLCSLAEPTNKLSATVDSCWKSWQPEYKTMTTVLLAHYGKINTAAAFSEQPEGQKQLAKDDDSLSYGGNSKYYS